MDIETVAEHTPEKLFRFLPSLGTGAIGFRDLKELRMFPSQQGRVEDGERVGAGCYIGFHIEAASPAQRALT